MRLAIILCAVVLAGGAAGTARCQTVLRGDTNFWLGMTRADLDSAIAARGVTIISDGTAFVACQSEEKDIEYEQYAFFQTPHGEMFLWRVTIGYRLEATPRTYRETRERLVTNLGTPKSDTWRAGDDAMLSDGTAVTAAQKAVWADRFTTVQLGGRWTNAPDRGPERMIVSWTDRRTQKQMEARRKKDRSTGQSGSGS